MSAPPVVPHQDTSEAHGLPTVGSALKVACVGNPNTGKSTLFSALAGLHAHVGNYPGVTVEKKIGRVHWEGHAVDLIDLPGTYSISPRSADEAVTVDVLLGLQPEVGPIDAILCIVDAAHLERNLFLTSQLLELGVPLVLVLNMWDAAQRQGITIDVGQLEQRLGVSVVVTEGHRRKGIDELRAAVLRVVGESAPPVPEVYPEVFLEELQQLARWLEAHQQVVRPYACERMLLDAGGSIEQRYVQRCGAELFDSLNAARRRLAAVGYPLRSLEADRRYAWARRLLAGVVVEPAQRRRTVTDRIDALLTHRGIGLLVFALLMLLVFQTLYTWAAPLMDACEAAQGAVAAWVAAVIPPGPLQSLLCDGVIAGVGGVLIFLPQIVLLFLFIGILEDCGYMARAAYMMDRVMAPLGLSGKSFLPLMSSFACAVPGIMATRVIDNHRERMVTILIAPLMSCSARLPVYLLLISAFIPATRVLGGLMSLQGLVLLAMSSLGLIVAVPVAWLLKRFVFKTGESTFVMELPDYKIPSVRVVLSRVYERAVAFVSSAGTLIFATTVLIWAAGYFPGDRAELRQVEQQIATAEASAKAAEPTPELQALYDQRNAINADLMRGSYLGRAGQAIEPFVRPLGWDWRIGVGVLASFPAREVIVATLGTIYSLGGEVDAESTGLQSALQQSRWPDGHPVYNVPVALSLMVFFALCAQCSSTLMIMRRETNSWRWPVVCFGYMTGLAYVAALITYQVGMQLA
ncbi:MAG: ferrous iron transport protein B [Planctomycetaceae bacterium]